MPSDETEVTRSTYEVIARDYAERWATNSDVTSGDRERFLAYLAPDAFVADVGSGPGRDASKLADAGCSVIALDLSIAMLREARQRFTGPLVVADMRALPIRQGCLDAVWACASFLHVPKQDAAVTLERFRSTLKEGGVLFLAVKEGEGETFRTRDGLQRFFAFYSPDELSSLMRAAGFMVAEMWSAKDGVHPDPWLSVIAVITKAS